MTGLSGNIILRAVPVPWGPLGSWEVDVRLREGALTQPPISCMCPTFARPRQIVEEAVYSFLNQDYAGDKELLILNDFDRQRFVFEHPQVRVVNVPSRFHSVGEKRNAAAALCRHDLLAVWDDDDIYLPHRLSFSVSRYDERRRFFKPSQALILEDGAIRGPKTALFHGGSLWHRSLFDEVGGYAHMGSGQDQEIEAKFERVIGAAKDYLAIQPREIFYLYRWWGTRSYHLSSFGRDGTGQPGNDKVGEYALRQLEQGRIESGEIVLQPHWCADYSQMVKDYVAALPAQAISGRPGSGVANHGERGRRRERRL